MDGRSFETVCAKCEAGAAHTAPAPASAAAPAARKRRRSTSGTKDFIAHIFQNVSGALHTHRARQNGVLIFNAKDAFIIDVHIGLKDGFPRRRAMPVAD